MTRDTKQELTTAIANCDRYASDLMSNALALSEMVESASIENKPREDGGRPLKILRAPLEDVLEYIVQLQASAKTASDELMHIKSEVSFYIEKGE